MKRNSPDEPSEFVSIAENQGVAAIQQQASAHGRSARRIASAIRALRLQWGQTSSAARVATMWTAMELLAHERYGPHTIERVVRSVVPFIASHKIRDMTDDVAAYLQMSGLAKTPTFLAQFADIFTASRDLDPIGLVGAISNKNRAMALVHLATDTPLVALRAHELHDCLVSGSAAVRRVSRTAQRVDWQLRRIYRLRNGVVHGGTFDIEAERLVEHLYLYASSVLAPLGDALANTDDMDIESAVGATDSAFYVWLDWLGTLGPIENLDRAAWSRIYDGPTVTGQT